jgi:hypothetical protein
LCLRLGFSVFHEGVGLDFAMKAWLRFYHAGLCLGFVMQAWV